ncbi:hypothetical protein [Halorubrum lipolyticum]|uniref:Uncharacterized protein n=1 Tax=Halorubrum lipolyticum DSM 21995 TaxID=1227482 RepID=M0NJ81_9EURY|nr:hypothetical protein [Halorubrum lipolyticum]EMA57164.1 hypothetical protein C469_15568 [Halorubrum lipolyticum DSM 21995]
MIADVTSGGGSTDDDDTDDGDVVDGGTVNLADEIEENEEEDDDDGGSSSGYVTITNDGTESTVNDADSSDGSDGSDTWGDDSDGSDGGDSFDTDSSSDNDGDDGDSWTDSGSGSGYTTITNDGTESTVNDTEPVQGDDSSDYEEAASEGIWGEGDGSAPDNASESTNADMEEQIDAALADQRAAFEEDIGALMESLPVPDQLGGSSGGGGLSPALGAVALLAVGGGALYVTQGGS